MSQDPAGNTQADPKSVVTLTVGHVRPAARRDDAAADRHDDDRHDDDHDGTTPTIP